ncbi:MAG: helix-turn-helix domain-containing protein [Tangfeifania sp.]
MKSLRYYTFPAPLIKLQKEHPLLKNLYLTETGEIEVKAGTIWNQTQTNDNNLLVYCIKGDGILQFSNEQLPVSREQFFVAFPNDSFKYFSSQQTDSRFLVAGFAGKNVKQICNESLVIRSLVPSVNNLVANREMLFDEIFNNLSKGFHDQNMEYINLCFGHLLGTFIFAHKTSDDLADEANPVVRRSLYFMNKNLHKKLTLDEIAAEVGYSATYFSTLFKKEINYSPLSYFSHLKILKACELLDYTSQKIKEISFQLGYSDPYYFTKDFKKKMGMSPRQYRNRLKN